jgi:diguanylate cyclase (GGDEF)-like protein/PAS domain S-box-containing protein
VGPKLGHALVIDDDRPTRDLEAMILQVEGWEVTQASGGLEGVSLAGTTRPDVIVCDLRMGDLDGFGVIERLGADPTTANIPVIVVTGVAERDRVLAVIDAGAHDVVVKPFEPVEFAVRCMAALRVSRAHRQLADSEQELRLLADHMSDLVVRCGADGIIRYASPSAERLLGWKPEELVGRPAAELCHPDDVAVWPTSAPAGEQVTVTRRILKADGSYLWCESVAGVVTGLDGQPEIHSSTRDITERKRYEEQLDHLANHDALTGLPNRALLADRLSTALLWAERSGTPVSALFVDLDGFKLVNDLFGHEMGDLVLVQVSSRLLATLRASDTVARYGGDEFVIILEGFRSEVDVCSIADRIGHVLAQPYRLGTGWTTDIGASVGVAISKPGMTASELLAAADRSMYGIKAERR